MIPASISAFFAAADIPLTLARASEGEPLILVNDAFCAMTGYPREAVIGRNCRFLQGPETEPEARAEIHAAVVERRDVQVCITNYRSDGTKFRNFLFLYAIETTSPRGCYLLGSQFALSEATHVGELEKRTGLLDPAWRGSSPRRSTCRSRRAGSSRRPPLPCSARG